MTMAPPWRLPRSYCVLYLLNEPYGSRGRRRRAGLRAKSEFEIEPVGSPLFPKNVSRGPAFP